MRIIMPKVLSWSEYQKMQSKDLRPVCCPYCDKKRLWCHGHYKCKSERNFVPIFRYLCFHCHRTCSTLPEYLTPQRWYKWQVQQAVLVLANSLATIAKQFVLSRRTVGRWLKQFRVRWLFHKDVLCQRFTDLDTNNFNDFWLACLQKISLAQAMYLFNLKGINIKNMENRYENTA